VQRRCRERELQRRCRERELPRRCRDFSVATVTDAGLAIDSSRHANAATLRCCHYHVE